MNNRIMSRMLTMYDDNYLYHGGMQQFRFAELIILVLIIHGILKRSGRY